MKTYLNQRPGIIVTKGDIFFVCFSLAFAIYLSWHYLFGPDSNVFYQIFDDAFYYFNVAYHIAQGHGSTFDGINLTNGYQPLWMAFILPIYAVLKDKYVALRAVTLLQLGLSFGAIFLVYFTLRKAVGYVAVIVCLLFFWRRFIGLYVGGVESAALLFSLALAFWYASRAKLLSKPTLSKKELIIIGLLLALVVLARFDYVWYLFAFLGCLGWNVFRAGPREPRVGIRVMVYVFWILLPAAVLGGMYALLNLAVFGHALPISAAMKSSFPILSSRAGQWNLDPAYLEYSGIIFLSVVYLLTLPKLSQRRVSIEKDSLTRGGTWLVLGTLMHYVTLTLFQEWAIYLWYFTGYLITLVVVAAILLDLLMDIARKRLGARTKWLAVGFGIAFLLPVLLSTAYNAYRVRQMQLTTFTTAMYEAALWLNQNAPPDTVVGMSDAGVIGYFSERPIVNLDGLANSYEYQESLKNHDLSGFLRAKGINHIGRTFNRDIIGRDYGCIDFEVTSRLYRVPGGTVKLCQKDEVYRSTPSLYSDGDQDQLIIWAVKP